MTDSPIPAPRGRRRFMDRFERAEMLDNKYTEAVLARHKKEGLALAIRARWVAMALFAVFMVYLNPHWQVLYYHAILGLLAGNGWLIWRAGRVGRSRVELALIFIDLAIMIVGIMVPNPFSDSQNPLAMQYRFGNFMYLFVILAAGTLAYSWRTVIAIGIWTGGMWALALIAAEWVAKPAPGLTEAAISAFSGYPGLARALDPNNFMVEMRLQEIIVFIVVAVTLGISARRFNHLLMSNAGLERERANLSRYFSPNVVEELSQNDEPLKQVRSQDIGVLFIDIIGFTEFSAARDPYEVIAVLREFHARMEDQVFRHCGTLDKYLGDGLMATFGTPLAGEHDATDALHCAVAMTGAMEDWNQQRRAAGEPEIHAGIGVHFGTAVLGDIGMNRLEFAVIGNSVNVASRLETLTRKLSVRVVISDVLRRRVLHESGERSPALARFNRCADQDIRGIDGKMTIWTLA